MDHGFYRGNRERVMGAVADHSVVILFSGTSVQLSADEVYPFVANRNFYYLTGLAKERCALVITKHGDRVEEVVFVEKVNPDVEKWNGKMLTIDEIREISGIEQVAYIEQFHACFDKLLSKTAFQNVYLDLERRGWDSAQTSAQSFASEIGAKYPYLVTKNIYPQICRQRTIKSIEEVERIRKAIHVTNEGIQRILSNACPGVMEYQLEAHFDFALKSRGLSPAYRSIIGSGKNATIMHYVENYDPLGEHDMVLLDLGAQYEHYKADITRTFPANGKFSERQRAIYSIVLQAEIETIQMIKPGIEHKLLNETTKRILADGLKRIGVIQQDSELEKYYFYNVSHYLGLDTHDVGEYRVLQPGMVLTIEPGLYIPEESIGVRIEDDVLVTENGYDVLSQDIIKTIDEIERFMADK